MILKMSSRYVWRMPTTTRNVLPAARALKQRAREAYRPLLADTAWEHGHRDSRALLRIPMVGTLIERSVPQSRRIGSVR
jgi:hypothetical protein